MELETQSNSPEKSTRSLRNLYLDPNNYRLINEPAYIPVTNDQIKEEQVKRRTFRLLAGDKNQNIQDLIESFKANGYLPVDQIQIRELPGGGFVVVEGNRRIAALKHLHNEFEERGIDLGKLNPEIFGKVPVVYYSQSDDIHHLTLMALKHVSGNKKWGEWNQAKLLEKLATEHGLSPDEICKRVGISRIALNRSLRALSFANQYKESDYGDQFDVGKFPMFREVVRNASVKEWIGWDDYQYVAKDKDNMSILFSWLSREPVEEEDEDGEIGLGDEFLEPALTKRDDISLLGKILGDEKALEKLKQTRNINTAYRASDLVFNERQEAAIHSVENEIDTLSQMAIKEDYISDLEKSVGRLQSILNKAKATGITGVESRSVYRDRVDSHFSEIFFKNYKKLSGLKLNTLSKVNIFAGLNNTGKTTLLEGIYLLTRQNDFNGILEIQRRRGKISEDKLIPEWFFENIPDQISLTGIFDRVDTRVSVTHFEEENDNLDKSRYLGSVELVSAFGQSSGESITHLFKGTGRETQGSATRILCNSIFSSPFFLNEPHRYSSYYHKSVQSKALSKINHFISEKVISTVKDVRLVDEWQRFLVDDEAYEHAQEITSYGEGLQRIFFISLLFASAQNGVILIDEFENAIHRELIPQFAHFIHGLSELFNVQVFLTSHSKECIDAFVFESENLENLCGTALVEDEGRIVARSFAGTEFEKLLRSGDVDLRRAK
jgi:AAA15 family ATPase/GTPase